MSAKFSALIPWKFTTKDNFHHFQGIHFHNFINVLFFSYASIVPVGFEKCPFNVMSSITRLSKLSSLLSFITTVWKHSDRQCTNVTRVQKQTSEAWHLWWILCSTECWVTVGRIPKVTWDRNLLLPFCVINSLAILKARQVLASLSFCPLLPSPFTCFWERVLYPFTWLFSIV